ncbi:MULTISPECIES: hypothetical protein [unclassified Pseudoalteromonas]|uniref:hypothetical protein n=1 Tax=unclassified Pseudoalteromonas TaxID=194690 RepID=UPI000CF69C8E|nr:MULTISPECIES: hypothetical protein [unclassified Pseudoalteromonas]
MEVENKTNKTRKSKARNILESVIGLAMVGVMISPVIWPIFVNEQMALPLGWFSALLSLSLMSLVTYLFFKKGSQFRYELKIRCSQSTFCQYFKYLFGYFLAIPYFVYIIVAMGIPTTLHHLSSPLVEPATLVLTVKDKESSYRRTRCSGRMWFEEYQLLFNDSICGMYKPYWHILSPGDKVIFYGKKTVFGFSYEGYKLHTLQGREVNGLTTSQLKLCLLVGCDKLHLFGAE